MTIDEGLREELTLINAVGSSVINPFIPVLPTGDFPVDTDPMYAKSHDHQDQQQAIGSPKGVPIRPLPQTHREPKATQDRQKQSREDHNLEQSPRSPFAHDVPQPTQHKCYPACDGGYRQDFRDPHDEPWSAPIHGLSVKVNLPGRVDSDSRFNS